MASFLGGSAFTMASQIGEGYILLTSATLRKFQVHEVKLLEVELDKIAREVRSENPPLDDTAALQKRNRKLGRLNQAALIIRGYYEHKR